MKGHVPHFLLPGVLGKGDYPEHLQVAFCADKQRSFEPFMCLDLVLER